MKYVIARKCKHEEGCEDLSYLQNNEGNLEFNSRKEAEEFKLDLIAGEIGDGSGTTEEELSDEIMIIPTAEV
tara:strand:- start:2403 stop:2618 length:216 start_codon:yes stop_codon:yes gene_type:complete